MKHRDILNYIIKQSRFNSYLEIGINKPAANFEHIKCKFKIGVDPNPKARASFEGTSDEFFRTNTNKFDLIFIDGLHTAEQVKKDFQNSLEVLNYAGVIVLHDTCPSNEMYAKPVRGTLKKWNGDVYRMLPDIQDMDFATLNFDDNGLTVVRGEGYVQRDFIEWDEFSNDKNKWLNLMNWEQFKMWYNYEKICTKK